MRLLPCDVFARVAPAGFNVAAAFEVELARQLVAADAPVVTLEARIAALVHRCDGFAVTFWTYHDAPDKVAPADYAHALERLHVGMRNVDIATPHRRGAGSRDRPDRPPTSVTFLTIFV